MDYIKLGRRIREARKARNWSQEKLAKDIGRSTSFLGHVERGTRIASIETLVILCDALGISADEALGRYGFEVKLAAVAADLALLAETLETAREVAKRIHVHL